MQLYSDRLITEEIYDNLSGCETGLKKAELLLRALRANIGQNLREVIEVLRKNEIYEEIADKMSLEMNATHC